MRGPAGTTEPVSGRARTRLVRGITAGLAAGLAVLGPPGPTSAWPSEPVPSLAGPPSSARPADGERSVTYRGLRLPVPRGFEVWDLERHPHTCVRFDRRVIYLGTPGTDQHCPAHAVGRTEAILVEPMPGRPGRRHGGRLSGRGSATGSQGSPRGADPARTRSSEPLTGFRPAMAVIERGEWGLRITATSREHPEVVERVLSEARYVGEDGGSRVAPSARRTGRRPAGPAHPSGEPGASADGSRSVLAYGRGRSGTTGKRPGGTATKDRGLGFDTCAAPSAETMRAWRRSPYDVAGIYIGGVNRACPDGNLTPAWVREVTAEGWRLLPIYVGRQAPCARQDDLGPIRRDGVARQGRRSANDAVERARHFGLRPGSAIYYDLEAYDERDAGCRRVVLTFLSAWTERLRELGYLSGVYSSAGSGIRHLSDAYRSRRFRRPDAIWIARWDGKASVWGEPHVPDRQWASHQRAKQYRGPHVERWGGHRIEIDGNVIDGPLASPSYRFHVTARRPLNVRRGPGRSSPVVRTVRPGQELNVVCQAYGERAGGTAVWDRLARGGFVADGYVAPSGEGGGARMAPECAEAVQVTAKALRVRAKPDTAGKVRGSIPLGGLAYVRCQAKGEPVGGSAVWDRIGKARWVSDHHTGSPGRPGFTRTIPRCPPS